MKADYHIHTEFSDDSVELMENQIERGIELGLDELCFTDHVDYGIKRDFDDPRGIEYRGGDGINSSEETLKPFANVNYPEYFSKIKKMQEKYGTRIKIKSGLESGIQTHTIPDYEKLFDKYSEDIDFILLSMHQVGDKEFWTQDFQRGKSQKEYNEEYYDEIYKVQQTFKNYSVLAHLDLLSRYDQAGVYPFDKVKDKIAAILELAIKDDKGIEINTSSWHYGLVDTQPSKQILKLYKDLGGKIITFGSDAHSTKYLADHFEDARKIIRDEIGIREFCTFERMVPTFHLI